MTTYGAVPDQLSSFGGTLKAQIDVVDSMIRAVDGPLNSIVWTGPAKDRFVEEWNGSFKQALGRLIEAFEAAGTDCQQRADGLRQVMGVG